MQSQELGTSNFMGNRNQQLFNKWNKCNFGCNVVMQDSQEKPRYKSLLENVFLKYTIFLPVMMIWDIHDSL